MSSIFDNDDDEIQNGINLFDSDINSTDTFNESDSDRNESFEGYFDQDSHEEKNDHNNSSNIENNEENEEDNDYIIYGFDDLLYDSRYEREIGIEASWTITSAKPGNGIDKLRDNKNDTYWQSDGSTPHFLNIHFPRKTPISKVAILLDFNQDESYTPKIIEISSGFTYHDLEEVKTIEVNEPNGWVCMTLNKKNFLNNMTKSIKDKSIHTCLNTYFLQISIVSMHQNGRDTHVRGIKIISPRLLPLNQKNENIDENNEDNNQIINANVNNENKENIESAIGFSGNQFNMMLR